MDTLLKTYFPIIRTREEVLNLIGEKEKLTNLFESWSEEQQEEFLDFCTGVKGVKILYDSFFKEIFNPEYHAERLEELLSLLLETKIRIKQILPNDSVRLADEYTLLITDIVIETEDGRIANLEIQKIGYDTGLKLETLQKSVWVALDIFRKNIENRSIENKLEAWLFLLSSDEPERIMELLEKYPEFREIYEEVYQMCRNVEGIMSLFSKELEEMDRNTVSYMIEELEAEVKAAEERAEQEKQERKAAEERAKKEMEERERQIAELQEKIKRLESMKDEQQA